MSNPNPTGLIEWRQKAAVEQAKREQARRNFMPFVKHSFYEYQENWHHSLIAKKLEDVESGKIKRLAIFMPPRHGKSELCTVQFPAWYLGRNPRKEVISTSYSADLSVEFGRKVRNTVNSIEYGEIFPNSKLSNSSKAADNWTTKLGGGYTATGIGGSITGKGAHCLIIDDPFKSRKEADSAIIRDMTWNWYTGTAYTRLAPSGAVILIMTRWHDDDLAGRILSHHTASNWHVLELPAIANKDEIIEGQFARKKGRALWPTRYNEQALQGIKNTIGPYEWSSQYQQNPVDEEAIEFHKDWFKQRPEHEVDKLSTLRYLTVDTAGKVTRESNYIGIVDNRVDREGNWNIKARKYKMDPAQLINYLFVLQEKYNYEVVGIEKTIYTDVLEPYMDEKMLQKGITLPYKLLKHNKVSKQLRIRGLIPYYKNGRVYHIDGECEELIPQLVRFPKSAEDDIIDALAYQLQIAKAPFGWENKDFQGKQKDSFGDPIVEDNNFDPHNPIGSLDI